MNTEKDLSGHDEQQAIQGSAHDAESHMKGVIARFKALWASFLVSAEGKGYLTDRGAYIVEVEKLRSEVFANLVNQTMANRDQWKSVRIAVDYDNTVKPVLFAKVVTTAKPLLPRLYKRQEWSLFKKHERVLLLCIHNDISCLDEAMTMSDLIRVYEECGLEMFSKSVPWIGVGAAKVPAIGIKGHNTTEEACQPILGNKVQSVMFDEATSTFVIQATDCTMDLCLI